MRLPGTHRKLSGWIAIFAIVWAALAPTISHALADRGLPAAICSAAGGSAMGEYDNTAPQPTGAMSFEHCAYCSLQAQGFALPAAACLLPQPAALASEARLVEAGAVALPRPRWSSAPPRAPPLIS